jgi:hypothetical protein
LDRGHWYRGYSDWALRAHDHLRLRYDYRIGYNLHVHRSLHLCCSKQYSSAACAPHVPTVSLCAPNIASFILNVVDPRVEVVATFNDVVDSLLFGASIAIPLVLSLATLVRYAARNNQSSMHGYVAEAGPKKLAAPVVARLQQQLSTAFLAIFDQTPQLTTTRSLRRSLTPMDATTRQLRGAYALRSTPDLVADDALRPQHDRHPIEEHPPSTTSLQRPH